MYFSSKDIWINFVKRGASDSLHSFNVLPLTLSGPVALRGLTLLKHTLTSSSLTSSGCDEWLWVSAMTCSYSMWNSRLSNLE